MKKFLIKICALLTVSSMLIGVVFMSDFATAYSMAAANTVETPESSRDALKNIKKFQKSTMLQYWELILPIISSV